MSLLLYQAVDVLPFPPRVGTDINRLHILPIQQPADNLKLLLHTFNHLVLKFRGDKRNGLQRPSFVLFVINLRIAHGDQMPHAPGDHSVCGLYVPVPAAGADLKRPCKLPCHAGLFRDIKIFSHHISSILINFIFGFTLASSFKRSSKLCTENR